MRSGFCSRDVCTDEQRGPTHGRCRMDACRCKWHDQDVREKAAVLEVEDDPSGMEFALRGLEIDATALSVAAVDLPDAVESLRMLHRLRVALKRLREVDAALVQHIYLTGEHGDVRIDGLPAAKVARSRDRKDWDERGAVYDYLAAKIAAQGGEMPTPEAVAGWVLELVGVSYVRVTPLRAAGLDSADYCTETPGSLGVTFSA